MEDEWGSDPSVQRMRRIFAAIDAKQAKLLVGAGVHRFDKRLALWRKSALRLFEQGFSKAMQTGACLGEKDVCDLYLHCLAQVLVSRGVAVPAGTLPDNPAVVRIMGEKDPHKGQER